MKRYSLLILLVMAALLLAQCAPAAPATPAGEAPAAEQPAAAGDVARKDIFVYAHPTTIPNLDPSTSYSNDLVVMANCYETLTFYNAPGSAETLSPKLAESWESNEDATEWTFKLRQGVKFQDGEPLNAAAVKYSIDKIRELAVGAYYIWDAVDTIEAVDDYTVKFTLTYSSPLDLVASANYAAWIFSPKAYEENGPDWFNEGHCAGTGPYTIDSYERGSRLIMSANEDYWGGWKDGQFKKVVFELIEDPTVTQRMIESGEADFTYQLPADNLEKIKQNPNLVVYQNPAFLNLVGLFNTVKPPLDNKLVRQALSYTFPYDAFMEGVMNDRATQAFGPVPDGMWGHSKDLFQYSYDLEKAKELLTEAGYPDGGFKLLYTFATGDLDEQTAGELWKAELAKLGIEMELQGLSWEAQWDLSKADPAKAQDVFVMYWWPDLPSPYSFLFSTFHSEDEPFFNLAYYSNPEFDNMINTANELTATDFETAEQMFVDAQQILLEDAASLFIYDRQDVWVTVNDLQGFKFNPAYPTVVFFHDLTME